MRCILTILLLLATPVVEAAPDVDVGEIEACLAGRTDDSDACVGIAANRCQEAPGGSSTSGIAECLSAEADAWDRLLNGNYRDAIEEATVVDEDLAASGSTVEAVADLRTAQRAWIAFRDAECDRLFSLNAGGTIRTIVYAQCRLSLTAERAIALAPDRAR